MMVFDLKDSKNIKMKRLLMAESDNLPRQEIFTPATRGEGRILTNLNIGDRRLHLATDSSRGDLFMILQKNDVDGSTNILPVEGFFPWRLVYDSISSVSPLHWQHSLLSCFHYRREPPLGVFGWPKCPWKRCKSDLVCWSDLRVPLQEVKKLRLGGGGRERRFKIVWLQIYHHTVRTN